VILQRILPAFGACGRGLGSEDVQARDSHVPFPSTQEVRATPACQARVARFGERAPRPCDRAARARRAFTSSVSDRHAPTTSSASLCRWSHVVGRRSSHGPAVSPRWSVCRCRAPRTRDHSGGAAPIRGGPALAASDYAAHEIGRGTSFTPDAHLRTRARGTRQDDCRPDEGTTRHAAGRGGAAHAAFVNRPSACTAPGHHWPGSRDVPGPASAAVRRGPRPGRNRARPGARRAPRAARARPRARVS